MPELVSMAVEVLKGLAQLHEMDVSRLDLKACQHPAGQVPARLPGRLWHLICPADLTELHSLDQLFWHSALHVSFAYSPLLQ